jgi:hypothetical protein
LNVVMSDRRGRKSYDRLSLAIVQHVLTCGRAAKIKMGRLYDGRRDRPVAWWQMKVLHGVLRRY